MLLADEEWTPQSGHLTPAQKLQRKTIIHQFEREIKVRLVPPVTGEERGLLTSGRGAGGDAQKVYP